MSFLTNPHNYQRDNHVVGRSELRFEFPTEFRTDLCRELSHMVVGLLCLSGVLRAAQS